MRLALHNQVRTGVRVIPYSSTRFDTSDALKALDSVVGDTNRVHLIYSVATLPAADFGDTTGWNREHIWPNSYGLDNVEPAFSDLHNLRACDANVNSARGNKWYDLSKASEGGFRSPAHVEAPLCSADSNSWQPPADQRGDIARVLFYMDIRYEGDVTGEPDLRLVENVALINASTNLMGRLSVLLKWNAEDPPDQEERTRDAAVRVLQGNANPFVANPGLAARIFMPKIALQVSGAIPTFVVEPTGLPVVVEYAENPGGPWTTNMPGPLAPVAFARARLAE